MAVLAAAGAYGNAKSGRRYHALVLLSLGPPAPQSHQHEYFFTPVGMKAPWFIFIESNTSGTGRLFARAARELGCRPAILTTFPDRYPYLAEDAVEVRVVPGHAHDLLLKA